MKTCCTCKEPKELSAFGVDRSTKDGFKPQCKECKNRLRRECYARNPANERAGQKKWDQNNPDKRKKINRRHEATPERQAYLKTYREKNREQRAEYQRELLAKNVSYKIASNLRHRLYLALNGQKKIDKTLKLLGCSWDTFRAHMEARFAPGMSWENYGDWHVDHVKPCASFDLSDPEQQKTCFHYSNLQPLWAIDNLKKNKRV